MHARDKKKIGAVVLSFHTSIIWDKKLDNKKMLWLWCHSISDTISHIVILRFHHFMAYSLFVQRYFFFWMNLVQTSLWETAEGHSDVSMQPANNKLRESPAVRPVTSPLHFCSHVCLSVRIHDKWANVSSKEPCSPERRWQRRREEVTREEKGGKKMSGVEGMGF